MSDRYRQEMLPIRPRKATFALGVNATVSERKGRTNGMHCTRHADVRRSSRRDFAGADYVCAVGTVLVRSTKETVVTAPSVLQVATALSPAYGERVSVDPTAADPAWYIIV